MYICMNETLNKLYLILFSSMFPLSVFPTLHLCSLTLLYDRCFIYTYMYIYVVMLTNFKIILLVKKYYKIKHNYYHYKYIPNCMLQNRVNKEIEFDHIILLSLQFYSFVNYIYIYILYCTSI